MLALIIAILEILLAIGFIGFWTYFFAVELKNPKNTEVYLAFEKSFPVPDLGLICPCLFISAVGLLLDQPFGIFFAVVAGGALLFLGLLDISFNIQNEGYTKNLSDTIMNLFINLVCLIFGIVLLIYAWSVF